MNDRQLMESYLAYLLGKPVSRTKRGELMDIYRKIALEMGVEESTPRMWRSRAAIPRHARRQIVAQVETGMPAAAVESIAVEKLDFAPAVITLAREVQKVYDLTGGKGEVWRSLVDTVKIAQTFARHKAPPSLRHLRPMVKV